MFDKEKQHDITHAFAVLASAAARTLFGLASSNARRHEDCQFNCWRDCQSLNYIKIPKNHNQQHVGPGESRSQAMLPPGPDLHLLPFARAFSLPQAPGGQ